MACSYISVFMPSWYVHILQTAAKHSRLQLSQAMPQAGQSDVDDDGIEDVATLENEILIVSSRALHYDHRQPRHFLHILWNWRRHQISKQTIHFRASCPRLTWQTTRKYHSSTASTEIEPPTRQIILPQRYQGTAASTSATCFGITVVGATISPDPAIKTFLSETSQLSTIPIPKILVGTKRTVSNKVLLSK